jgi:hypothetical protein
MQDEHGATSSSTLTITVTGTNDGPVLQAPAAGSITEIDQHFDDLDRPDGNARRQRR